MPKRSPVPSTPALKSLGKRRTQPFTYAPEMLDAVEPTPLGPGQSAFVQLRCERFTSLCPVTGQPDWAELRIGYIPDGKLVESKALKEYLTSFRQHGGFHEDVCRTICADLVHLLHPRYLEVEGRFDSRGSIAIWPFVQFIRPGDAAAQRLGEARLIAYGQDRPRS